TEARILSVDEIKADAKREQLRKLSGQTEARACKSIGKYDKQNCPALLPAGQEVTVTGEKLAGLWRRIESKGIPGFGGRGQSNVLAAFVKEIATEEAPLPSKGTAAPTPAQERAAKLEEDYAAAVTKADWEDAARLLNAFNEEDIEKRLRKLSGTEQAEIQRAA